MYKEQCPAEDNRWCTYKIYEGGLVLQLSDGQEEGFKSAFTHHEVQNPAVEEGEVCRSIHNDKQALTPNPKPCRRRHTMSTRHCY